MKDYAFIVLEGIVNNYEYLEKHIIREQKKAKKEHIPKSEFYFNCIKILDVLILEVNRPFWKRKDELALIKKLRKEKGTDTANIEKELELINKQQFPVNLFQITKGNFFGDLYYNDIMRFKTIILKLEQDLKKKKLQKLIKDIEKNNNKSTSTRLQKEKGSKTPTIKEIALYYVYKGELITKENCKEKVKKYGHNSGDALYNHYTFFSNTNNRKSKPHPYTKKKLENKITLLENVCKMLDTHLKKKVLDEIKILNHHLDNDFL